MKKRNLPKKVLFALIALLIANVIWAAANPVIKITLGYIPTFTFLFLRFLIVCIIILPFTIIELKKNPINPRDYFNFFMLGIFAQSSIAVVFEGLRYTGALDTAVIGVIGVLLSVSAGHYFYKEKVSSTIKLGLLLATLGTFIVILEPILEETGTQTQMLWRLWGNFLVMIYSLFFVLYVIWGKMSLGETSTMLKKTLSFIHLKPMHKRYSSFTITAMTFYVGLFTMIPFALMEMSGGLGVYTFSFSDFPHEALFGLLYMALFSSLVAYFLFQWALDTATVGDTAVFSYLGPVFTVPFAYLLLREAPTPIMLAGSALIALGVIIAESRKS